MGSRNLFLNIIIRSCILALEAIGFAFLLVSENYILSCIFFLIFMGLVIELIFFINSTNRRMAFFFDAIRNDDSTLHFTEKTNNKSLRDLNASLNKVNEHIKKIKVELREQEQYFQAILEHVTIGILSFNDKGYIFLANSAAKKLLNYEQLTHIDQLKKVDDNLHLSIKNIKQGEQKLVSITSESGPIQLSLKTSMFKTVNENLMLLAIQDIKSELEEKELDSWIKLIRVLTHEIMNTVAPITSLAQTLLSYYQKHQDEQPTQKIIDNTVKGLSVINERGTALISFVDTYRKLTRLPQPTKKRIALSEFSENILTLFDTEPRYKHIKYHLQISPIDLEIIADEKQISQVLINLLKNSSEAILDSQNGVIKLEGSISDDGLPQISVIDNGPGIPKDIIENIFIPFFTTKDTGSGIGLSLSRQIMQLHGGTIKVYSKPNIATKFTLFFNKNKLP